MGRSPGSAPLHMTHHSIARSAVSAASELHRRYRKRCWRAAVVAAILAVAGTANSADAPPLLSPEQMNAGEIQLALQKLNVLGRVLYIAAHPDDENTNLMAFWANGSLYDAAYLSVTRGDGGQNIDRPGTGRAAWRYSNRGIARCAAHRSRQAIFYASDRFRVFEDG